MKNSFHKFLTIARQELRIHTFVLFALHLLIGFLFVWATQDKGDFFNRMQIVNDGWLVLLSLIVLGSWYIATVSINDIADFEIDAVNLPNSAERPLQNQSATKKDLIVVGLFFASVCLSILTITSGWLGLIFALIALGLAWIYSMPPIKLSHRGILAPLLLPIGYIAFPMLLPILYSPDTFGMGYFYLVLGFYLIFTARVMLKDYRDIKGDKMHGKTTFLIQAGHKATTISSAAIGIAGSVITSIALFGITSDPIASIIIMCLGLLTITFYRKILNNKSWPEIKPHLPRLGRLYSLQSVAALLSLVYFSSDINQLAYYAVLVLLVYITISKVLIAK